MRYGEFYNIIKPSVPCIELGGAYATLVTLVENTWNRVQWYETYYCTSDFEYREDINNHVSQVHVYTTGLYRIDFEVALVVSDAYANVTTGIFVNGIAVFGSYSTGYYGGTQQINSSKIVYLKVNDEVDFRIWTDYYSVWIADYIDDNTDLNLYYSRARITYLPSGGWNNNSGGNVVNRGIRR